MAKNSSNPAIPVELTEAQFNTHFAEHIKPGKRGPKIKIPLWKVFNYRGSLKICQNSHAKN